MLVVYIFFNRNLNHCISFVFFFQIKNPCFSSIFFSYCNLHKIKYVFTFAKHNKQLYFDVLFVNKHCFLFLQLLSSLLFAHDFFALSSDASDNNFSFSLPENNQFSHSFLTQLTKDAKFAKVCRMPTFLVFIFVIS